MNSYDCCSESTTCNLTVKNLSSLLKLIGDESRLRILCILRTGTHCVCEIEKHLELSQTLISHHLKDLKDGGIIEGERKNKKVHYSLSEEGKRLTEAVFNLTEGKK